MAAAEEEIREVVAIEEQKIIEEAPTQLQDIPQQPVTDREDDWFVLLDVVPRDTSYVPPGKIPRPATRLYQRAIILSFADLSLNPLNCL